MKQEPSKFIKALAAFRPIHTITDVVVWVIRGTPLMLQLIIIFYGPGMWFDNNIWGGNRMAACVVAFVINYACYFSVIYRGGIQGVPWPAGGRPGPGLHPAADLLQGHLAADDQAHRAPMSNEIITLVKDTSIARIISLQEIIWAGYAS